MLRFASADLWPLIADLSAKADSRYGAVAYVTSEAKFKIGRGDVLVTDAGDDAIKGGLTSADVLARASKRGAKLYSVSGLHAKVFCLGRYIVVGSANASANSARSLIEAGVVSDNPVLVSQGRAFIEQLAQQGTEIDAAFLRRIAALEVVSQPRGRTKARSRIQDRQSRIWLVGLHEIAEDRFEHETADAERGKAVARTRIANHDSDVSWVRFTGPSKFRSDAKPGDVVIQIWRPHAKARVQVYFPAPLVHRQDEPSCTRFYVEEFADSEDRSIPWTRFMNLWKKVADGMAAPPIMCARRISDDVAGKLIALWPE
jgi:hypothetical protein